MRTRRVWTVPLLIALIFTPLALLSHGQTATAEDTAPAADLTGLVGNWRGTFISEPGEDFVNFSFRADGTVQVSNQHGLNPVGAQTTGTWSQTGDHQFVATLPYLYHDAAGAVVGSMTLWAHITLTDAGDSFTTLVDVTTTDATGAVVISYTGAPWVQATRLGV